MSAPAITYFCENGHIALDVPHGYIGGRPTACPHCESTMIVGEIEWCDPDYGEPTVPLLPISFEVKVVDVPIYDVSRLFKEREDKSA